MLYKFPIVLHYNQIKMSLLPTILGGCLAVNYQTLALAKSIKNPTLATNQNQYESTLDNFHSNTSTKTQLITGNYRYPRPIEKLPPSTKPSLNKEQEPIFNPIEPNPFPNLRYVVYIESENPILLGIIRQQFEPRAVLRSFGDQKVIQVGSFSQLFYALDLIDYLEERGIRAERSTRDPGKEFGDPVEPSILAASVYPPVNHSIAYGISNIESYYLLIPGKSKDLALMTYKLALLGVPNQAIKVTETPENVVIGPFAESEIAEKWQRYLLDSGFINVDIYYGR